MSELSAREKTALRNYWKATYAMVRIRADGSVEAKREFYHTWGLLETPAQAKASAQVLIAQDAVRVRLNRRG